jgi:predicted lipoprotein with Yx(FWY)xxD motif
MLSLIRTANLTRLSGLVAVLLVAAACSSSGGATTAPTTAATAAASAAPTAAASSAPSEAASEAPSAAAGGAYTLTIVTSATVGKYLSGEDGKTLYVFSPDSTPNKSTCTGSCATNWPPFTLDPGETAVAGAGVTGTIATFARDDGSTQVSYNGKPLYYFANDKAAGDTNGQGIAGKWKVAAP